MAPRELGKGEAHELISRRHGRTGTHYWFVGHEDILNRRQVGDGDRPLDVLRLGEVLDPDPLRRPQRYVAVGR